jgi:putative heme-binding domain-containing protein
MTAFRSSSCGHPNILAICNLPSGGNLNMSRFSLIPLIGTTMLSMLVPAVALGQEPPKAKSQPPKKAAFEPAATDPATMKVMKDFKIELIYSVPKSEEGSWVSMCVDPKGRLIVSDQYGSLYRITPSGIDGESVKTRIEKIPAKIGMAQGLVWAFDGLYVVVNGPNSGLYKVTSSNNNDVLNKTELLKVIENGNGEHGAHAVMVHPDGKRLTVVCGNQHKMVKYDSTRVSPVWGEDHLSPRLPDGKGFMKGVLGPGGAIYNVSPDGKEWELFSAGYRNEYDAAYNHNGDLFTFDADMEWDFNTPWYRPTRVCLVTSGSEFGWRNGTGKYPPFYPDTVPPILNVGPGSPTGVCFGYGTKFPQKYRDAFFICDWSYGKLYAVHLTPEGSAYKANMEEFLSGTPLPLTDIVVNPTDGAMYFTIGGRRTKSGLYRVTYTGSVAAGEETYIEYKHTADARKIRKSLEKFHGVKDPQAVDLAWQQLASPDRFMQFAARTALEFQDSKLWREKAISEKDPVKAIHAILALARVSAPCPEHTKEKKVVGDAELQGQMLSRLSKIQFTKLTDQEKLDLLRTYEVVFNRFGVPGTGHGHVENLIHQLEPAFPDKNRFVNGEMCQVLIALTKLDEWDKKLEDLKAKAEKATGEEKVKLEAQWKETAVKREALHNEASSVASKTMKLLREAPTQEEQLEYILLLRVLKNGWTLELHKEYFTWFLKTANYKGGESLQGFTRMIKADAVASLTMDELTALKDIINANPATVKLPDEAPRPFVKAWKVDDLTKTLESGLKSGRDYDRGRKLFAAGKCFACHRYDSEGGNNAPDLTGLAGRYSQNDVLEKVLNPSKSISDQYAAVEIRTNDERIVIGRIVNLNNDKVMVNTDMLNPGSTVSVERKDIESMKTSKISMMPSGLLDTFKEDEILDLMAYLLSRAVRNNSMFKK